VNKVLCFSNATLQLLDRLCRIADQQQRFLYTEATSETARTFLKRQGFAELLRHNVRPHAPFIYIMVRRPAPPEPASNGAADSGGKLGAADGRQARQPLRSGSVRTRE
jgi:hypothetical protein